MAKIVLIAVVVWLLFLVVKRYLGDMERHASTPEKPEDMVQCAKCGMHLPKSDSILVDQKYYCCEAHSKQTDDHNNIS